MTKDLDSEQKFSRSAYADGPRLLADIGATHARFALETAPGVLRAVRVLKCDDFSRHRAAAAFLPRRSRGHAHQPRRVRAGQSDQRRHDPHDQSRLAVFDRRGAPRTGPVHAADRERLHGAGDVAARPVRPGPDAGRRRRAGGECGGRRARAGHRSWRIGRDSDDRRFRHPRQRGRPHELRAGRRTRVRDPAIRLEGVAARVERAPHLRPRHGNHLPRTGAAQWRQRRAAHLARHHHRRAGGAGSAVPGNARMLQRHAGRRRGQPGGDAGRVRRHLHRRRYRAAHGRVVRRLAVPRALRSQRAALPTTWRRSRPT
jgi:hypothetical protein